MNTTATASQAPALDTYDKFLVMFSGGKDSTALVLHLLDCGISPDKIELWHHDVDGEGHVFMDWESTRDYCRKFAAAFRIPIYFSWKVGGFRREMLRENSLTAPVCFEIPAGEVKRMITEAPLSGSCEQMHLQLKELFCSRLPEVLAFRTTIKPDESCKGWIDFIFSTYPLYFSIL